MAFLRWIKAVFTQWVADVTGGVLIGALALYSELSGCAISPRIYLLTVVLVFFQAMFLAWRKEESARIEAENRIIKLQSAADDKKKRQRTIDDLSTLVTEADPLFDKGRKTPPEQVEQWLVEKEAWLEKVRKTIETDLSVAEARLFMTLPGGGLINYSWNRRLNQELNMLLGYQQNLQALTARLLSDSR